MQDDFGSQLRRARTQKGLDVNTVARRLRIRPDIIQAIEDSDFERMPPRGYARNMINSYAHLLGLNASEITRQYLDEQYAHQVNMARMNAPERGTGRNRGSYAAQRKNHYEVSGYEQGDLSQPRYGRPRDRYRGNERPGRRMYDDYDSGRVMSRSEAERVYRENVHRSRGTALGEEPVFNAVASPAPTNTFGGRLSNLNVPMIIVAVIVAILIIVLLVLLFGPKGTSHDAGTMPVASVSETEASEAQSSSATLAAPTSFTFSYTVNSGASTWIEVYIDGEQAIASNVDGPSTKAFTTSGELEFICTDPTGVKAVQDGKDIPLTPNEQGVVDIKISFNDVLAAWQREHGMEVSSSSSSSSSQSLRGVDAEARSTASQSRSSSDEEANADEQAADEEATDEAVDQEAPQEEEAQNEQGSNSRRSSDGEYYE